MHLLRTNVLEELRILIQPHLENSTLLRCPEGVNNSHAIWSAGLISEKLVRKLPINSTKKTTDKNEKSITYVHKLSRKDFRL